MDTSEASYIIKQKENEYVNTWNQTRYIMHATYQAQIGTEIKLTDVMKFSWDVPDEIEVVTNEDKERLKLHAEKMKKQLQKKQSQQNVK